MSEYTTDRHGNFSLKSVNVTRIREKARWRNRVLSRADASFTAHSPANRPPISAAKVGLKCNFKCSTGSPCVGVSYVQVSPRCWSLFFLYIVERSLFLVETSPSFPRCWAGLVNTAPSENPPRRSGISSHSCTNSNWRPCHRSDQYGTWARVHSREPTPELTNRNTSR